MVSATLDRFMKGPGIDSADEFYNVPEELIPEMAEFVANRVGQTPAKVVADAVFQEFNEEYVKAHNEALGLAT